ncbi:MAG TPA: DUF6438 domain-containing protein [Longimicrobiaceae bacterium]|jgi:hypothetical protein
MRRLPLHALLAGAALAACQGAPRTAAAPAAEAADSVVLERTRCYGTCPAYRLSVAADGAVAFVSRYPDEGRTEAGRVAPEDFRVLVRGIHAAGFFALPDTIANDPAYCAAPSTDSPTATVAVYSAGTAREVVDYRGCAAREGTPQAGRLAALRSLAERIDSVAGAGRWVRPARR